MNLSQKNLVNINAASVIKPSNTLFELPEKVLQFGTGVLLRGLPDYFIDKANRNKIFNGRIVVVKSTDTGDSSAFAEQDNLYTLCIRGIDDGREVQENIICSSISRVLSANQQWDQVLQCAQNPGIKIIISNTTEVGIQLLKESIFESPPFSFPAKLLAFLHERYTFFDGNTSASMIIIPTELITENGKKLRSILIELAQYNNLDKQFIEWLGNHNYFCNSLVDCIVPGKPDSATCDKLKDELGYDDKLLTISEVYRLWAIEGDDKIRSTLSFADADNRIIITPSIEKYKELKLRLLNGTHTLSCGLAYLSGVGSVRAAMENKFLSAFITDLMLKELAPAIPYTLKEGEANEFGLKVLDRFRNPQIQHQWLSITMQYTSKLAMRAIPLLIKYYELYKTIPENFALGFAAYLLFTKPVKKEDNKFFGKLEGKDYFINDDKADYYFDLWRNNSYDEVVKNALQNTSIWQSDLSEIDGFEKSVKKKLYDLMKYGVNHILSGTLNTTTL